MKPDRRSVIRGISHILLTGGIAAPLMQSQALAMSTQTASAEPAELPEGAQSRFAQVNGIRMHYVTMGTGPLTLLLHGWPQTWYAWHGVMPRLAKRYTVVAPDLRGTGLTERTPGGYDKRSIAGDLRALIAQLGGARANVVGHDMGGKAAYVLAHIHPEAVSKLVLVDCLLPGTENMDALRGGAWHYGFHMAPEIPEMLTAGRERDYIRTQIKTWSHRKDAITEAAITEYARHYAGPGGMTAGFNYYRALREDAQFAETLRGRKLPMPVMAIAGRQSAGDRLAQALRDEAADLTSAVADECGHFVAEEAPDFFCEKLESFLA